MPLADPCVHPHSHSRRNGRNNGYYSSPTFLTLIIAQVQYNRRQQSPKSTLRLNSSYYDQKAKSRPRLDLTNLQTCFMAKLRCFVMCYTVKSHVLTVRLKRRQGNWATSIELRERDCWKKSLKWNINPCLGDRDRDVRSQRPMIEQMPDDPFQRGSNPSRTIH